MKCNEIKLILVVSLVILFSITSHIICFHLFYFHGAILIPSSVTYMLVLALMDFLAVSFNKKIVFFTIFMETVTNAIFLVIINLVMKLNCLIDKDLSLSIINLFKNYSNMYIANLIGSLIAFIANYYLFNYLYKKQSFFTSTIVSSVVLLFIYTPVTDYLAFNQLHEDLIANIVITNIISNIVFLCFWSTLLSSFLRKEYTYDKN